MVLGRSAHLGVESVYRDGAHVESRFQFRGLVAGNGKSVGGTRRFFDTHRQLAEVAEPRSEGPTFGGSNFSAKRFSRFSSTAYHWWAGGASRLPICVRLPVPPAPSPIPALRFGLISKHNRGQNQRLSVTRREVLQR